ncbi:hypothetical protein NQ317_015144, partial [Molorchus minor]
NNNDDNGWLKHLSKYKGENIFLTGIYLFVLPSIYQITTPLYTSLIHGLPQFGQPKKDWTFHSPFDTGNIVPSLTVQGVVIRLSSTIRVPSVNTMTRPFEPFEQLDILFPEEMDEVVPVPRIHGTPRCAEGSTFCENFESYPYRHLKHLLDRNAVDKKLYFGKDESPAEFNSRTDDEGDDFLCSGMTREIFPKLAQNKNDEWRIIVNQGKRDGYVQGLRIELCRREGAPCNMIGDLPLGYRSVCKQKYMYRRLLSVDADGSFIADSFKMPSSCCCSYRRDMGFMSRSALVDRYV